jgi:hypothetical protein
MLAFDFTEMWVCDKNWPKLCISLPWSSYSELVIHNGHAYNFFTGFKFFKILAPNPKYYPSVLPKMPICEKK